MNSIKEMQEEMNEVDELIHMLERVKESLCKEILKKEEQIEKIQDVRIRRIARMREIRKMNWVQIAIKLNTTPDAARKEYKRYIEKYNLSVLSD